MNATPRAPLCMPSLVNPSLYSFLWMMEAFVPVVRPPRWPVLLHPYPSIPREPFNFSIFLPNVTVLSDERDDSQITAVYNHASPQTHVHETAEQRIMGKTSE